MTSSPPPENSPTDPEHASFAERLKQKYGEGVDPEVSLDRSAADAPSGASSELLRRLADHSLKESRYKLQGEIARGGMGAILKVWDEDLRRTLAMKVILGKGNSSTEGGTPAVDTRTLGRFLEEAQVTGQLDHPGIAPVHELGLDSDGRVYFTMKLVKGRDLKHIFDLVFEDKEGWNETRALSVMLKVCEAMAYAHSKGVIHRDLKPANVMVGSFGEVYVMDWGLARVLGRKDTHDIRLQPEFTSSLTSVKTDRREERDEAADAPLVTMDGDVMGTPAYMPPEQARGEIEKLGPRSDVYSMGALLYHLLARRAPYVPQGARVSNRMVLHWVLEGPPKRLHELRHDVPAELAAICEKAMSREAAQRYADTLALAEDLRAYLEHRVVGAYETGTWAETKKWIQRNRPLATSVAAGVFVLGAGLVVSLSLQKRAEANEQTAKEQEALAKHEKSNVLRLSAFQTLDDLTKDADALWPADPGLIERYRAWLERADKLVARIPEFNASLLEIEKRALPPPVLQRVEGTAAPELEDYNPRFADEEDQWWHTQMGKLIRALLAFSDAKNGLMHGTSVEAGWGVTQRFEFAASIRALSTTGPIAATRWSEAVEAIALSEKYRGVRWPSGERLTAQLGLLPIGADPESGLWEFAHLQTGEPAQRNADGKLIRTDDMGLVFVLIPGGSFTMGAQRTDPSESNYDPQARKDESPVHDVTLSPYFLSKYEMTQGQWLRFAGENPSQYGPTSNFTGQRHTLLHPVEQVSWTQCAALLTRLGLVLPSEAQWENGCRGGTNTVWWSGTDRESLRGKVNLADQTAARAGAAWQDISEWPDLEDGWVVHAPIGSLPANPLGLHEVHGNVWEWCADGFAGSFYGECPKLDPVAPSTGGPQRVFRGGCYSDAASNARSASRGSYPPVYQGLNLGLRPAKSITP